MMEGGGGEKIKQSDIVSQETRRKERVQVF